MLDDVQRSSATGVDVQIDGIGLNSVSFPIVFPGAPLLT